MSRFTRHWGEQPHEVSWGHVWLAGIAFAAALYSALAPLPDLGNTGVFQGTLGECTIVKGFRTYRPSSLLIGPSTRPVLFVRPASGGEETGFDLRVSPWPMEKTCAALAAYQGAAVTVRHSINPDLLEYLVSGFRDSVWQLEAGGKPLIDYPSQRARIREHAVSTAWGLSIFGGFVLLLGFFWPRLFSLLFD